MKRIVLLICLATLSLGAQAQLVGATNRQQGGYSMGSNNPTYRPTGYLLQFEAGYPFAVSVGYQLNPNVMVGGGIGINLREYVYAGYYRIENYWGYGQDEIRQDWVKVHNAIPLFVEARFSTPRYRWSLFADVKLGVNFCSIENKMDYRALFEKVSPIFMSGQVGFSYKRLSFSLGCGYNPSLLRLNNSNMVPETYSYICPIVSLSYQVSLERLRSIFL